MDVFDVNKEQRFEPTRHVERILDRWPGGDVSLAWWKALHVRIRNAGTW